MQRWHRCDLPRTPDKIDQARNVILKATQKAAFAKELSAPQANQAVSKVAACGTQSDHGGQFNLRWRTT